MIKKIIVLFLIFVLVTITLASFSISEKTTGATKLRCELVDGWLRPNLALGNQWDKTIGKDCNTQKVIE